MDRADFTVVEWSMPASCGLSLSGVDVSAKYACFRWNISI